MASYFARQARRPWRLGLVLGMLLTLPGCTGEQGSVPDTVAPERSGSVVVTRGDIVSVVVLPAVVQAAPTALLTTPVAGTVEEVDGDGTVVLVPDDGEDVRLEPPAGVTTMALLVEPGQHVPANFPVARLRLNGFGVVAEIDASTIFRLYTTPLGARAEIRQGPGPFDCPLVSRVPSYSEIAEQAADVADSTPTSALADIGTLTVVCVAPPDLTVFAGMPAVLALTTADVKDVLTVPVEAVAGTAEHGRVLVEDASGATERDVVLGPTDGIRIQIVSGIEEGDRVVVPGPVLDEGAR